MKGIFLMLLIITLQGNGLLAQNKEFTFLTHKIKPGQKLSFNINVRSKTGDSTFIPLTVIHGKKAGPVLGLIAGIHGYEYPPIMAMQKFPALIEPDNLSGTILIVHIANVNAFYKRSVFYNPADGKNLNRTFPGNKDGTITECLAYTLSNEIISRCDYLVDIHAGDASEDLHPYVGYYEYGSQAAKAKQMAEALGFPWMTISENTPKPGQPTKYCSAEGVSRDIPTVAIEYGKLGHVKPEEADFINNRLINMMRSIGILAGSPEKSPVPIVIKKRVSITSDHTGIFYTDFKSAEPVKKGLKLGIIKDLFGNVLQEVICPVDGFIIYLSVTPPINKGETLFSLAEFN